MTAERFEVRVGKEGEWHVVHFGKYPKLHGVGPSGSFDPTNGLTLKTTRQSKRQGMVGYVGLFEAG